jgi:ribonucleoside-triphosphate reductase
MEEHSNENSEEFCCPGCGGKNIHRIARVVGYFSEVGGWNKGKQAELKDRRNGNYD